MSMLTLQQQQRQPDEPTLRINEVQTIPPLASCLCYGKQTSIFLVGALCCRRPQPVPQNPRLSAPSRRNRVAILRSRNRRRSPPGGRWADLPGARRALVQVDRVARHRPPAPASPVRVRLGRLRRTQTIEAEAVTPVGEVTTTDDTIMQPAPSP